MVRPPFCQERLRLLDDGRVVYKFRRPWPDGSTHLVLDPVEFLGKLAALIPPPRAHLLRYHGVLAPNARRRRAVVPADALPAEHRRGEPGEGRPSWSPGSEPCAPFRGARRGLEAASVKKSRWRQRMRRADLLKRTMGLDALACPRCGGRMEPIAEILEPGAVAKILRSMGLPDAHPLASPARPPPQLDFDFDQVG